MSFADFASKMKAKKQQQDERAGGSREYNFEESYRIRAKMLGVLLRDARQSAARTIDDCARLLRVHPTLIEAWEFGDATPSLPQLEMLAYYLDVPISHFWGLETLKISRSEGEQIQPEYVRLRDRMIGALLRQARETAGLTVEALSEQTHLDPAIINQYELGEAAPSMPELSMLASSVGKNMDYFLETNSQIGELLAIREAWKHFANLPEDVRAFAANPTNIGFIHIAVMLSQMPTDRLRQVGASIVDITM